MQSVFDQLLSSRRVIEVKAKTHEHSVKELRVRLASAEETKVAIDRQLAEINEALQKLGYKEPDKLAAEKAA